MKEKLSAAIMSIALLGLASPASATTYLDTIGAPPAPYTASGGWTLVDDSQLDPPGGSQAIAVSFSLPAAATITDITAYIWGGTPGSVTLGIMADASGVASGTFLNSQSVGFPSNFSPVSPVVLGSLTWSLPAGSYWLAAIADSGSNGAWEYANTTFLGALGVSQAPFGPGNWFSSPDSPLPMALITGTGSEVPLPAALPLFATGVGVLALLARRRKRKAAALAAA